MATNNPLISVIMPAYNAEKTIDKAITSVLAQTYTFFELLIINDGSKDDTLKICERYYVDDRITIITQENKGLSGARNTGLDHCHGQYVCFIDSDDWYETEYLSKMINRIQSDNADCIVCNIFIHRKNNTSSNPLTTTTYTDPFKKSDFIALFETGIMNSVCNKLYKKEIIETWNLRFSNITIVEDLEFNLKYFKHTQTISTIEESLYHYNLTTTGLTTKISADMFQNYISVHAYFLSMVEIVYHQLISQSIYHQYLALTLRYIHQIRVGRLKKKEVYPILDKYLNNLLVKASFKAYHPHSYKELIFHYAIRFHFYNLTLFLLRKTNK